jgi:hypothetical protein
MFIASAEGAEAEFMYQYVSMAPPSVRSTLGIDTARMGGGVVLSVRNDVTGYWSKALGFGFDEPVTHDLIASVVEYYRTRATPGAVIQIAPAMLPRDWETIRGAFNIRPDSHWVKLACRVEDFRPGHTWLRVGPIGPSTADEWASVTLRGFGMPEEGLAAMMAASLENRNFRPFAAWDGDEMVAAANLFVHGEIGSLNSTATLPGHRNQGAQSGLIAALGAEAAKAGCRWLVAETGRPANGSLNPSLNNLMRAGLRPLYDRQNWIWQSTGPAETPSRPVE